MTNHDTIIAALEDLKKAGAAVPSSELGRVSKMIALFCIHDFMEKMMRNENENPYPPLLEILQTQTRFLTDVSKLGSWVEKKPAATEAQAEESNVDKLKGLYVQAWTVYSRDTYDHSVDLIVERLRANGFDEKFFAGKTCFDGGCGTARFAVAMAKLGAKEVVAADMGQEMLDFAGRMITDIGVNVELVNQDITDLSRWSDGYFDFVVSNGVLHHTIEQERGIREHFRVTKPGGTLWLYLYGAGGIYWPVYEAFKPLTSDMTPKEMRRIILDLQIREGGVYSFLDLLAPIRTYYSNADIERILKDQGQYKVSNLKGMSEIDDTDRVLAAKYGADIFGPDGEIRMRIDKAA